MLQPGLDRFVLHKNHTDGTPIANGTQKDQAGGGLGFLRFSMPIIERSQEAIYAR